MSNERLYTEKEISAILKRSGEMHAEKGAAETQGLTLAELQQIAAEVGISADDVASAAAELERSGIETGGFSWPGFPTTLEIERVVQGEITEEEWPEIASAISDAFGVVGSSGQVGRMMEWTYTGRKMSQLQVSLTPRDGQTKIRIRGNYRRRALVALGPLMLGLSLQGAIIAMGSGLTWPAMASVFIAVATTLYFLIRFIFTTFLGRKERAAQKLIRRIEQLVASSRPETAPAGATHTPLDVPAADPAQSIAPPPRNRDRA
ncbi:MAG: hypothetical protein R2834_18310 [Rhodothermales bacterium]